MRSLALFAPTFSRVQEMLQSIQRIKNNTFKTTFKRIPLQMASRAFLVANSIERNVTEIQSPVVEQELANIEQFLQSRDLRISYDYKRKGFQMQPRSEGPESHPRMHVRSCALEKMDHPHIRQSLYFHELKDLQTYFTVKYPKNCPKFVRDVYRKNSQNQLLDSQNPLGLPIHASPLLFLLNFQDKFLVEFYCRYGNINIRSVRMLSDTLNEDGQRRCHYILSGMNIPRQIQKIVNEYCKEELLLDEPEFLRLHRLSYIGGRVQEVEDHLNLYEFFSAQLDS